MSIYDCLAIRPLFISLPELTLMASGGQFSLRSWQVCTDSKNTEVIMKRFIALAALLVGSLVALSFDAAAAGEAGALILSKNPQLSKIPDWPQPTGVGEPADCNKDGMQQSLESMRKLSQTAYRCVVVQGTFGGQPWESGSGASGLYQLQLHPNSPMVWRVFKRDEARMIALIAEFDATGKLQFSQSARSPTNLLTRAETAPVGERQARCNTFDCARIQGESSRDCITRKKRSERRAHNKALICACGGQLGKRYRLFGDSCG